MSFPRIGSGTQACAACKYQRRKCAPDCVLAPYFPPDHQRQFLNAHKLFGVSNILKIIRNLDPVQKDQAMRTMIFQADVRANDPVGGCFRMIHDLQRQIEHSKAELDLILHQLAICRAQQQQQQQIQIQDVTAAFHGQTINPADTLNGYSPPQPHLQPNFQSNLQPHLQQQQQQQPYLEQGFSNHQWSLYDTGGANVELSSSSSSPSSLLQVKQDFDNECEDIKPLLGVFDGQEESIVCSDKAVLKQGRDSKQPIQEKDLKGAASLFTLTNCNR